MTSHERWTFSLTLDPTSDFFIRHTGEVSHALGYVETLRSRQSSDPCQVFKAGGSRDVTVTLNRTRLSGESGSQDSSSPRIKGNTTVVLPTLNLSEFSSFLQCREGRFVFCLRVNTSGRNQ